MNWLQKKDRQIKLYVQAVDKVEEGNIEIKLGFYTRCGQHISRLHECSEDAILEMQDILKANYESK